jgi:nucleoside-diphosphate-sugar epimerase
MAAKQLIAFGFGYVAAELARNLVAEGWTCAGTVRSEASAQPLRAEGYTTHIWPGAEIAPPPTFNLGAAAWLISVPPDDTGCPVFRSFGHLAQAASWIGYLSTTGVYGDLAGGWAFEETPLNPQSREATNRAAAEAQWTTVGARTFRLPGIYGPRRSAIERVQEPGARRIVKPGQLFSRAHVADIASALHLSIASPATGAFNICDDEPAPADDVLTYAANLLGIDPPPTVAFEDANLSPMAQRFYAECKRVSNARVKAALGWRPEFPTYREGLRDCQLKATRS